MILSPILGTGLFLFHVWLQEIPRWGCSCPVFGSRASKSRTTHLTCRSWLSFTCPPLFPRFWWMGFPSILRSILWIFAKGDGPCPSCPRNKHYQRVIVPSYPPASPQTEHIITFPFFFVPVQAFSSPWPTPAAPLLVLFIYLSRLPLSSPSDDNLLNASITGHVDLELGHDLRSGGALAHLAKLAQGWGPVELVCDPTTSLMGKRP